MDEMQQQQQRTRSTAPTKPLDPRSLFAKTVHASRKELCRLIAKHGQDECVVEHMDAALHRLTNATELSSIHCFCNSHPTTWRRQFRNTVDSSPQHDDNDGVTPLILACDRKLPLLVHAMTTANEDDDGTDPFWKHAICGQVLHCSSAEKCGGNTAAHSALYFPTPPGRQEERDGQAAEQRDDLSDKILHGLQCVQHLASVMDGSFSDAYEAIFSARNAHGDTPLMMMAATTTEGAMSGGSWEILDNMLAQLPMSSKALSLENKSEESVLLLGCRAGHYKFVSLLLSTNKLCISKAVLHAVQKASRRLDCVLQIKTAKNQPVPPELRATQGRVHQCLTAVQEEYSRQETIAEAQANKMMEELLLAPITVTTTNAGDRPKMARMVKTTKSKKRNAKKRPKRVTFAGEDGSATSVTSESSYYNTTQGSGSSSIPLNKPSVVRTTTDGHVVSKHVTIQQYDIVPTSPPSIEPTLENLFREQCREATSLCLEPSMMLYNAHKLALTLSPSQLEAMERLHQGQLEELARAKEIQARVRSPSR